MQTIQIYYDIAAEALKTQVWPHINDFLTKYNLPTTLPQLRQDIYNMQRPFTHNFETKVEYFIKDYKLTTIECIVLTTVVVIVLQKIITSVFCRERRRYYRDVNDKTLNMSTKLKERIFQYLYNNFSPVRNYVEKKITQTKQEFIQELTKPFKNQCYQLPKIPLKLEKIQERLNSAFVSDDANTNKGNISGTRYCLTEYEDKMKESVKNFIFHNPMHCSEFPGTRQMESEIIKMTCKLYNSKYDYGIITQGGSESIMVGILAHRNYFQRTKNIFKPNIVMPISAHVAFNKGCYYYNVEPIITPLNEDGTADVNAIKKAINKNTIMIVASNPNYATGMQDDIPALAKLAKKHKVGLHVDSCLGSFVMPYAKELGAAGVKPFDFSVDGVTSISCDHHKYGMAPKGISLVMFSNPELRKSAYFSYTEWTGGLYATAQPAGSRSAAPITGCWFAMMYHGVQGYKENAKKIISAVKKIKDEVNKIPELTYIGNPETQVIAFAFKKGIKASIYQLDNEMHTKGWILSGCQKPNSVHVAMTLPFSYNVDKFIKDLKDSVKALIQDPNLHATASSGAVGLYGASGQIPDSVTKQKVLDELVDCFTTLGYDGQDSCQNSNKTTKKSKKNN